MGSAALAWVAFVIQLRSYAKLGFSKAGFGDRDRGDRHVSAGRSITIFQEIWVAGGFDGRGRTGKPVESLGFGSCHRLRASVGLARDF